MTTKPILSPLSPIVPTEVQEFERYLPTAFNEELTLLQKVNKVIYELNKLGLSTNGVIESWNKIIEWLASNGIEDMVDSKLEQWLLDGTLFAHLGSINALIFNADNTGSRGTSEDLQNAIDFIDSQGGGTLYIPAGTYLIDYKLLLCANLTIEMDKGTILKRAWGGGFFQNNDWENANTVVMKGKDNITISGGVLDGNYAGLTQYPATTCDMVIFAYGDNYTFRDVTFLDVLSYHALDLNGVTNVLIENCQFKGYANVINTDIPRESIQIGEGQLYEDGRDTYKPCKNIVVRHCYFGPSNLCGSPTVAIGNHYSRFNVYNTHITIEDNTIEGCIQFGIRPYKWTDVAILNNTITGCPVGIQISNPSGGTESSKDIYGNQTNTPQSGYDYLIEGNTIREFTNYGIFSSGQYFNNILARPKNIKILNNEFSGTGSGEEDNGISLVYWENVRVSGNAFKDTKRGMVISGSKFVDYMFNKHDNMHSEGFYSNVSGMATSSLDGYYNEHLHLHHNEVNGTQKNGFYLAHAKKFKVDQNDIMNSAQLEDGVVRGGIFVDESQDGRIQNNFSEGSNIDFNINVNSLSSNIVTFNNSGVAPIQLLGTNCQNGFYSIDVSGNIIFKPQVG